MNIRYIGENLWTGQLGHISLLVSIFSAFLATLFFYMSSRNEGANMLKTLARIFYLSHFTFLVLAISCLYSLIFTHHFEYDYVWRYSARELPLHYLISSFWAGQEGSFMLWAFWQSFLGLFLINRNKKWESPTLFWVSLSQFMLMFMIAGIKLGSITIGLDPFILMRELSANLSNPVFQNPDYIKMIVDGNGMNPLLMNYWMVIHPPILFLGYSSVLIPFSYAMAGYWNRDYEGWRSPALPWLNFTGFVLGLGIILGGAWAYVSLTFGGFWAWDPVENASLVPWLASVATLHTLLISRKKPQNISWAAIFISLAYFLVLYASYLTRSGVLKDTSAHAFGEEGRTTPLVVYMLVFLLLSIITFIVRRPKFDENNSENLLSREFWMFIGALVLVLSAFQIIITTSIPVINTLLGTNLAPPTNNIGYYNAWQMPYALLIAFFIGFSQSLKFGDVPVNKLWHKTLPAFGAGIGMAILFVFIYPFSNPLHYLFLVFLVFGLVSSCQGIIRKIQKHGGIGPWIAHFGINLFLLGVLLTFSNNNVISHFQMDSPMNTGAMAENQMLYKGVMADMGPYQVKYVDFKAEGKYLIYQLNFYKKGKDMPSFSLYPSVLLNSNMGNVFQPDTRTLLTKDIYGYIVFAPEVSQSDIPGFTMIREKQMDMGDSLVLKGNTLKLDTVTASMDFSHGPDAKIDALLKVKTAGSWTDLNLGFRLVGQNVTYSDGMPPDSSLVCRISNVSENTKGLVMKFYEKNQALIVVKVMMFPFILVLWLGAGLIFLGFLLVLYKRLKNDKAKA
ncbi:MAG: cytochrome c biogenesis protein CcsA [Bacteroidota bacterium]